MEGRDFEPFKIFKNFFQNLLKRERLACGSLVEGARIKVTA